MSAEYEGKGRVRVLARILSQSSIDIQKKSLSFIYIRSVNKNAVRAKSRLRDTMYHTDVILYSRQVFD